MDNNIYINCDLGEWDAAHVDNRDADLMPYIDLCNIACGGHAGSPTIIEETLELAALHDTQVGAHPGYADRVNFGRAYMPMSKTALVDLLRLQIDAFLEACDRRGIMPYHIKPHGALYHACHHRPAERDILLDLLLHRYSYLVLIAAAESDLAALATRSGLSVLHEAFIDRRYMSDLRLMDRSQPTALITDPVDAKSQYDMISRGSVMTDQGAKAITANTLCIHGDNVNATTILQRINGQ